INILAAYDITIFDENGEEYEPEAQAAIEVTFDNEEIREALAEDRDLTVYHMDDIEDVPEKIAELPAQTETVKFSAKHFSIYIVGEDGSLTDEDGEKVDAYTVNLYQWVYNDTTLSDDVNPINTQTVVGDDYIIEPEVPEIANHMFDGWFTEKQDKNHYDDGEYPGYQFDFSKTVNENLETWAEDTVSEGNVINLYSDYDPAYYVYYMTEEKEGMNSDVVYTDVYHVDDPALNTSNAEALFKSIYVSKFVDSWYYYDENNTKQTIQSGDPISGDMTIYPVMSDAIWVYFEMGTGDDEKVQAIDPIHIESSATEFGELPEAERAGYEFEGWYTKGGDEVTNETNPQDLIDETESITLYAGWTPAAAAYTVNIWRQKATDGQPGIDQKTVQNGEEYSTYINYYDYAESYTVSAEQSQLKTGDTPTTDTVYNWSTLTGYGWNDSSDGTEDYEGFEYNQTRTENDLATITMQPDGSTIINIFYDRVTVTYHFGSSNNTSMYGTLIGLYDTNTKVADDVEPGGTANGWIDPGQNYGWNYSSSSGTMGMSFLAKFALTENTRYRSNEVNFTRSSTSYSYTLYYYLEVTDPDRQVDGSSTTITIDNVTYVLDQAVSVGMSSNNATFYFSSKYIGYEYYGYNTNGGTSINTDEGSASVSNNGRLYIFNKAIEYDIELYSNHDGEQLVWSDTYKYGAPLGSVEFPDELDAETYGPASWYHFTGIWYEDPTFAAEFQKPDTMPHYNLVAYANWEPNIVTVTFQSNIDSDLYDVLKELYGEENVTTNGEDPWSYSITVTAGDQLNYDLDDGLTANVEGHNYQYACWMNTGTNEVFNFMNYIYKDTTLQVYWVEEIEYFLRYNINNEAYADTEAVLGHAHQSSSYAEVREFTDIFEDISDDGFIRWASEPDGSGDSYYPDDLVDFTRVTSVPVLGENDEGEQVVKYYAYDLYAVWAGDREVSLTLDYNYPEGYEGEKTENQTLDVENLEQVYLSEYAPEKTSIKVNGFTYNFAGWAYSADAQEAAIDADGTVAADNIDVDEENDEVNILYAVWERAETFDVPIYKYDPDRRRAEYVSAGIEPYEVTNYSLEGAEFVLSRSDDGTKEYVIAEKSDSSYYYTYTVTGWTYDEDEATALASNLNGYIEITNLEAGTYTLTETKAPEGYYLLEESIVFAVDSEGNLSIVSGPAEINNGRICIANTEITSAFELEKKDEGGNTLSGAKFILGVYAENNPQIFSSDAQTYAVTPDGLYDYYYFKLDYDEESGSYVLDSDYWYDTRDDATVMTTGTDGTLKISKLITTSMLGGTYFLIETEAPEGYELLADPIVFTVSDDGMIQITVSNGQASMNDDGTVMTVIDEETPNPSLSVEKTAKVDENYKAKLGDEIDYEITVTNNGNVMLENITVKDTLNGDTWTI
ncbi:MAG: InlB B-repeat-containing protein, partial [Lachnospiraceae bacterium]|nr:InlB B-repeat-containing protein [Lachnospiraceae bacterium]